MPEDQDSHEPNALPRERAAPDGAMGTPGLEIDHVFLFVDAGGDEIRRMARLGFTENSRRAHAGQGTANAIYCFDNAYLELLWVDDAAAVERPPASKARLGERARWRAHGGSPFGLAWRAAPPDSPFPFPCWDYAGPAFPAGMTIPVADSSGDLRQPFLFLSPGDKPPKDWTDERAGTRQREAGHAEMDGLRLELPAATAPSDDLLSLADSGLIELVAEAEAHRLVLTLSRTDGGPPRRLALPEIAWLEPDQSR
jgi:hypothetical protein